MNGSREAIRNGIEGYRKAVKKIADEYHMKKFPNLELDEFTVDWGTRYARIVCLRGNSRSVHSFVDRRNGDILKAASWRAPAKHPRGSVLEEDFGIKSSGAGPYGVRYLIGA